LIDKAFDGMVCFQLTGIQMASMQEQLINFNRKLRIHTKTSITKELPTSWPQTFFNCRTY
jgi:hypothetical protein